MGGGGLGGATLNMRETLAIFLWVLHKSDGF